VLFVGWKRFLAKFVEWGVMVKIRKRLVKKRYFGKAEYSYPVYSFTIPKEFHEVIQAFLEEELEVDVEQMTNRLTIMLTATK
jgi:hypothetical protein